MADEMDRTPDERDLVLREEQIARVDAAWRGSGSVRARKVVDTYRVVDDVPVRVDEVVVDRVPVEADDSGRIETLPDGSISIPVYEEEVVVEKRTILRERVIIRRDVVTETERVETELRKERVEIEADEGIEVDLDDSAR
jgi:uncharacterized protein (TIGR02271 family)